MIIIYRPDGEPERSWDFDPQDLLDVEATAIERVTGWTYFEFGQNLIKGSVLAQKALLWVLRKRTEPTLKFKDVSFRVREFDFKFDAGERAQARANLPELDTEAEQAAVLAVIGQEPDADELAAAGPKA